MTLCFQCRGMGFIPGQGLRGGFSDSSAGKEPTCNAGDAGNMGLIPELGKIPWRRTWQITKLWTEEPGVLQSMGLQRDGHD